MERQCQCAKPHEACGIFGIAVSGDDRRDPAAAAYNALFALQHRGQESAGIAVRTDRGLLLHKHAGLVPEVFSAQILESFRGGSAAIGHVRYGRRPRRRDCRARRRGA